MKTYPTPQGNFNYLENSFTVWCFKDQVPPKKGEMILIEGVGTVLVESYSDSKECLKSDGTRAMLAIVGTVVE